MESKIIQIQSCVQNNIHVLTALCEDGSVYNAYDCNDWELFEPPFKIIQKNKETHRTIYNKAMITIDRIENKCDKILKELPYRPRMDFII